MSVVEKHSLAAWRAEYSIVKMLSQLTGFMALYFNYVFIRRMLPSVSFFTSKGKKYITATSLVSRSRHK